jgi:hypothetical protein
MKIRPGDGPGEWQPVAVYPWRYILGIVVFGALAIAFARKHMWIFMVLGLLFVAAGIFNIVIMRRGYNSTWFNRKRT